MVGCLTKLVTFFTTSLLIERQMILWFCSFLCATWTEPLERHIKRITISVQGQVFKCVYVRQRLLRDRWNKAERSIYIAECTDRCVLEVHFIGDAQFVLGELERPHPDRKVQKNQQNANSRSQAFHKCLRCCFVEVGESSKSAQRPNICVPHSSLPRNLSLLESWNSCLSRRLGPSNWTPNLSNYLIF